MLGPPPKPPLFPYPTLSRSPRGTRRAEHVRAEDPAEDHADALPAEDLSRQRDRRRHRCDPVEAVEDDEEDQPERSEEHTSELQSQSNLVCRLLLEKKKHPTH